MRWLIAGLLLAALSGCASCGGGGGSGNDAGACDDGRACPVKCSADLDCALGEACQDAVCGQPAPTSTQYNACALDADCPRGDFCKLGACSHECLTDSACQNGTVCSSRGRCIAEASAGAPPEPTAPSKGVPNVAPAILDFGRTTQSLTFTLSNTGGEPFDFRILSSKAWVSAAPFEGHVSGQPVTVTVTVDTSQDIGEGQAFLGVNTSAGFKRVDVAVATSASGAWAGALTVNAPLELGEQMLFVNLDEASGTVSGWVDGTRSFLYPYDAKVTGAVTQQASGPDQVSFSFSLPGAPNSQANPALPNPVVRDFVFTGTRAGASRLEGTFTETFKGLVGGTAPAFSGPAVFVRTGALPPGAAAPDLNLTLAPIDNPYEDANGALRQPYQACTSCPGAACSSDPIANGNAFLKYAPGGVPKLAFYNAFWSVANAASGDPFTTGAGNIDTCASAGTCAAPFDAFYLRCAQYWYWKGTTDPAKAAAASALFLDATEVNADYALYLGNAFTARAFDAWFNPSQSLSQEAAILASGEQSYVSGLHTSDQSIPVAALDPAIATVLNGIDAATLSGTPHSVLTEAPINGGLDSERSSAEHLRRLLRTIDGGIFVANERATRLRRLFQDSDASTEIRRAAVRSWLDLATASGAFVKAGPALDADLATVRADLEALGRQFGELREGRNALGFAPGFVPFYWSKDSQGTNYQQIKATADANLALWSTLYQDANNSSRSFEGAATSLTTELSQQLSTLNDQLKDICGSSVDDPDDCGSDFGGSNASQMAQQLLEIQASTLRVQQAQVQLTNLYKEIQIEEQRAAQVAKVHQNNAQLIDATGKKVLAADEAIREINTEQQQADSIIGGIVGAFTNPVHAVASIVGGIAHAVTDGIAADAREQHERDKANALTHQQSQIEYSYAQTELINSAATVKTRLLQMDALKLDIDLALINLSQSKGRVKALYDKAARIISDRDRVQSLTGASARHSLHYRVYANYTARQAGEAFRNALTWAYLATRALEYQLNATIDTTKLWNAHSPNDLNLYMQSLANLAGSAGSAQSRTDVISLRDQILGLNTPVKDLATANVVEPRDRFRLFVADPRNRDENGNLHIRFSTDDLDNPLFSSSLASDRIRTVKINLIGDNLGANVTAANVRLVHGGTSYLRSRVKGTDGVAPLVAYDVSGKGNQPRIAVVQAGINAPNNAAGVIDNIELQERAILSGPWELVIDQTPAEPANANLNVLGLDDIQIVFTHDAYTIQ